MARKDNAVDIPRSPKAPWERYDPLSIEVYGEPFEIQLPSVREEDEAIPEAREKVEVPEAVEVPTRAQEEIPDWVEQDTAQGEAVVEVAAEEKASPDVEVDISGAVEAPLKEAQPEAPVEVPMASEDEAVPEAVPIEKKEGEMVVKRRVATQPEKAVEPVEMDASQAKEKVMEPTRVTRRRVVRRRKVVR